MIACAFNTRRPDETHRARLRVEIGRLRALVKGLASIEANHDFGVSFTPEEQGRGEVYYNYVMQPFPTEEAPGISVFYKDDAGDVLHTYATYGRGVEVMMGTYNLLDLTPKGRDERDVAYKMEWVRHHDRYEPAPVAKAAPAASSCCAARA